MLHDIDPERLDVAEATAQQVASSFGGRATGRRPSLDRRAALDGADFVINMIQVGGIDATRKDLEIPRRHGLRQTIGDTTGVGGVFRALRTFPVLTGSPPDMRELCPDAWLLNYTNPMAMNVWWLSGDRARAQGRSGCATASTGPSNDLCELIGVPLEGTRSARPGVNHQAWLLEWAHDGEDLYPRLRERIDADPELERRVRVEIFRRIGYYPTETSEHSAEYLSWFLRSDEQIERFRLRAAGVRRDQPRRTSPSSSGARTALAAGEELELEERRGRVRAADHPLDPHRHRARDPRERRRTAA